MTKIEWDEKMDLLVFDGMRFDGDLLRAMASDPLDKMRPWRVVNRKDGIVICESFCLDPMDVAHLSAIQEDALRDVYNFSTKFYHNANHHERENDLERMLQKVRLVLGKP